VKEQREDIRIGVEIDMNIDWLDRKKQVATSFNYSDGGILTKNPFHEIPAVGTPMTLQVTTLVNGKEAPLLPAVVIRATMDEIAFKFTFEKEQEKSP
jgi:hypothetical protein